MLAACLFAGGSNGALCSLDGLDLNRFAGAFVKQAAIDLDQSYCLLMDRRQSDAKAVTRLAAWNFARSCTSVNEIINKSDKKFDKA
jgi:hypothetical protein